MALYREMQTDLKTAGEDIGNRKMEKIINFIITRARPLIALIILASIPFVYLYTQQHFRNDLNIFFVEDDPELVAYNAFRERYGNDEIGVIIVSAEDVFKPAVIGVIRDLSAMLAKNRDIQRVFSITEEEDPVGLEDTILFKKIIPEGDMDPREMADIRARVLSDELRVKNLISADGANAIVLMEFEDFGGDEHRHAVLTDIRDRALAIADGKATLRFSGAYIDDEMFTHSHRDYRIFTPITLAIIFIITAVALRSLTLATMSMVNLGLVLVWSMGVFTLSGESVNMVTTIIPPILLAVSIADALHLLFHYQDNFFLKGYDHTEAVASTVRSIWIPCLFTSLTTAIGFFSFILSSVRPPRTVGIFTAIGVIIALLLTLTWMPASLVLMRKWFERARSRRVAQGKDTPSGSMRIYKDRFQDVVMGIGGFAVRYYKSITLVFVAVLTFTFIGMFYLRFETNISSYLPDDSPARADLDFLKEAFGGYAGLEVILRANSQDHDFTHPESLAIVDDLKHYLLDRMAFTPTLTLSDYFKKMNRAFNENQAAFYRVPEHRGDILDFYELGDPDTLDRIVSLDRMETRISFRFLWASTEKAKAILDQVEDHLKGMNLKNYTATISGQNKLYILMISNLKESQLRSGIGAFIMIFIMMLYVCRNLKLALLSMIPNLFPIVATLGFMGWLDVPLNVTNIMIASVTIGIAVDDSIHFITWFRRHSLAGLDRETALRYTFRDVGKPLITTTLVLCLGFLVLLMGSITPTQTFGMLAGFSLFLALLADLFFLPPLILLLKPKIRTESAAGESVLDAAC